ncbi:TraR/DksA family transcriptional regulator [Dickeya fangzhongdai]|uniref:TraR/DksA family transcriptional regulator n=1 Tax=Dickeya fangzhongdai TaxID=1778540 RepID=UPI00136F75A1|nr:TraR/DksA family transcriptional regulator [Dickeya fangzhongdai]UMB75370.1 TraR/DksA family transcriptional regulator [Dickeya fangzhongdai]
MADHIDISQEQQETLLAAQIQKARMSPGMASQHTCEDCNAPIPEARRIAVPGVSYCVTCQEIRELKQRHYRGAL